MLEPLPPAQQQADSDAAADHADAERASGLDAEPGVLSPAAEGIADQQASDSAGPPVKALKLQQGAADGGSSSKAASSVLDGLDRVAGHLMSHLEPAAVVYARCSVTMSDAEVRP